MIKICLYTYTYLSCKTSYNASIIIEIYAKYFYFLLPNVNSSVGSIQSAVFSTQLAVIMN